MTARLLKDPSTVNSRIFVGHLQTDELSKHELEDHFSKYGNVVGSLLNRGFGFVQFEDEQSAQKAIQNEHGTMFKGRRIDVKPAKKDAGFNNAGIGVGGGGIGNSIGGMGSGIGNNVGVGNSGSVGFNVGAMGTATGGGTGAFGPGQGSGGIGPPKGGANSFGPGIDHFNNTNDGFNKRDQNFIGDGNNQFDHGSMNRSTGSEMNESFENSNRGGNNQFSGGLNNSNRLDNQFGAGMNQNRNQNNQGPNTSGTEGATGVAGNRGGGGGANATAGGAGGGGGNAGGGGGGGGGRPRGTRGGKNRNKNRDNRDNANNFRDRSPLRNRIDDKVVWDLNKTGGVGPGGMGQGNMGTGPMGRTNFARDPFNDNNRFNDFKQTGMRDMNRGYSGLNNTVEYSPVVPEKNDCEIIVVNKLLTEYAETIEMRLKKIGLTVDLLFPNEDVLLSRVLGNIASRGCLYALVITPVNKEHHSLTLNILHGLPQEHRNMPVEDALNLIARDFSNFKSGGHSVPLNTPYATERHPDAIQVLLNMLADNHQLTVLQYDRVLKYLEVKREEQLQSELGDAKDLPPPLTVNDPKQAELQSRILNILNSNKNNSPVPPPTPVPAPGLTPVPVPPANWGTAASTTAVSVPSTGTTTTTGVSPSPLLNDPTVQKALDSLLQGNLLKNIGSDQQNASTPTPLFAAFPNIGRF